jgi:hypothetical protein
MIRSLRRAHRLAFLVLGLAVPAGFAVAIGARRPPVVVESLPTAPRQLSTLPELASWPDLFPGRPIVVRLLASGVGDLLEVHATGPLDLAEPLLYSTTSVPSDATALPADARLLGALDDFSTVRAARRDKAGAPAAALVLYSLGHGAVVAVAPLPERAP